MRTKSVARATQREQFVEAIIEAWRSTGPDHTFKVGDLLIKAKKALPHGQFEAMIESDLPFKPCTARR